MEAKDIIELAKKDQEVVKDLQLLNMSQGAGEALIRVIEKITKIILEKTLVKEAFKKAEKKVTRKVICFRCQETGHIARDCKGTIKCKHCGQKHFTRECPTRECKECGKRHPKGQCKKTDKWCKWCRVWGQHTTKECQSANILKRLAKLEKIRPSLRPKSLAKTRRVGMLTPRGRGGPRGKGGFKPRGRVRRLLGSSGAEQMKDD